MGGIGRGDLDPRSGHRDQAVHRVHRRRRGGVRGGRLDEQRFRGPDERARAILVPPGRAQIEDMPVEPDATTRMRSQADHPPGARDREGVSPVRHPLRRGRGLGLGVRDARGRAHRGSCGGEQQADRPPGWPQRTAAPGLSGIPIEMHDESPRASRIHPHFRTTRNFLPPAAVGRCYAATLHLQHESLKAEVPDD